MSQQGGDPLDNAHPNPGGNAVEGTPNPGNPAANLLAQFEEMKTQLAAMQQLYQPGAVPMLATPTVKKCKVPVGTYNMSPAEFRSYSKDVRDFQKLTGYTDNQVVLQIRLNMDTELKRCIDTNYPNVWDMYTTEEAIKAVESIVKQESNIAVFRKTFDNSNQNEHESIREYSTRLKAVAVDCEFICPFDPNHDLTDYHLINRIRSGLVDENLQQEVLQKQETLKTLESLIMYCESYESAKRDKEKLSATNNTRSFASASVTMNSDLSEDEILAAVSMYKKQKQSSNIKSNTKKCRNCGYDYRPGHNETCFAKDNNCHNCGKRGHLSTVCKAPKIASGIIISAINRARNNKSDMPTIQIRINGSKSMFPAIPDTGAQVSVAGENHLTLFSSNGRTLNKPDHCLTHVGGGSMEIMGVDEVNITYNNINIKENIYYVKGVKNIFLSLKACKELKLIHRNFPNTQVDGPSINSVHDTPPIPPMLPKRPGRTPWKAVDSNIFRLKQWLLDAFGDTVFNTMQTPMPAMTGPPVKIHLEPGTTPYAIHTPAPIPIHWKEEIKEQLDEDERKLLIRKVPPGTPVNYCSRMLCVAKANGKPRRVIDYVEINKRCKRETHYTPTPFEIVTSVPKHTYKSKTDASNGYHQVLLDEESQDISTFLTIYGRYQYLRLPQGLKPAGDAYCHRYDTIIEDIPRKSKIVDDTILYDFDIEQAFFHVFDYLIRCGENGITLNPEKFEFCQKELSFAGYLIGWESFRPSDEMISAIQSFPMPENPKLTDIRAWFGLVNQLAPFLISTPIMSPFRELLKGKVKHVYWDESLKKNFVEAKEHICALITSGLTFYEKSRETAVVTDWSRDGIGFIVLQQHCSCQTDTPYCCESGWKLIFCGSRCLLPSEQNYSVPEGEGLAICWALQKAKFYLLGHPGFTVITDHRPHVQIFGSRELQNISNPRLFRFKEKTLMFNYKVVHIPGKANTGANTLSRYPISKEAPNQDDVDLTVEADALLIATVVANIDTPNGKILYDMKNIKEVGKNDPSYMKLQAKIHNRTFSKSLSEEDVDIRPFFNVKDRLTICNDVIFYTFDSHTPRVVIPNTLRKQILQNLMAAHQGQTNILSRVRNTVYWPGIDKDVAEACAQCKDCKESAPSQSEEPYIMSPVPEYPMQQVVADLFEHSGYMYLIYACRLTAWVELAQLLSNTRSSTIINIVKEFFQRWGVPEELTGDGGPNISSKEFTDFLDQWGVKHRLCSAYYPTANGRAESAVKSMKRLIKGNTDSRGNLTSDSLTQAILQYRNTPLRDIGKSPAQLALGRELRDGVPLVEDRYKISNHWSDYLEKREQQMSLLNEEIEKSSINRRVLPELENGLPVLCQNQSNNKWDKSGTIVECLPYRQYRIKIDGTGRLTLRNRRHIRPNRISTQVSNRNPFVDTTLSTSPSHSASHFTTIVTSDDLSVKSPSTTDYNSIQSSSSSHTEDSIPPIIRRSTRDRKVPVRFQDFVLNK